MSLQTLWKNRANVKAAFDGAKDIHSWFAQAVSLAQNLRTERTCANPNYNLLRREGIASAEAAPGASTPVWDLRGYWGLHGYLAFTGGGDVSVTLYARDPVQGVWFEVETKTNVFANTEFHFDGKVRNRPVCVRIHNFNGTVTGCALTCSPE